MGESPGYKPIYPASQLPTHPIYSLLHTGVNGTMSEVQTRCRTININRMSGFTGRRGGWKYLFRRLCDLLSSSNKVREQKGSRYVDVVQITVPHLRSSLYGSFPSPPSIEAASFLPLLTLSSFPFSFTVRRCNVRNNRHLKQCESILINHFKVLKLISGFSALFYHL